MTEHTADGQYILDGGRRWRAIDPNGERVVTRVLHKSKRRVGGTTRWLRAYVPVQRSVLRPIVGRPT
jgi:hypothetical protein